MRWCSTRWLPFLPLALMTLAFASCSDEPQKVQVEPPAPPRAPEGLHTLDTASDRVVISWRDLSDDELGFRIERQVPNVSGFALVDTVVADEQSYTDLTVETGTRYDYRVQAYRLDVASAFSNEAPAVAVANIAPLVPHSPAPADRASGLASDSLIVLSWECSDPDGDLLTYQVYFGSNRQSLSLASEPGFTGTSLTVPQSLELNRSYFWRVVAQDPKGVTRFSPVWVFSTVIERIKVPAGYFVMGDTTTFEHPASPFRIRDFDVDRFEVTNQQYANYLNQAIDADSITISGGIVYDPEGRRPYLDLKRETRPDGTVVGDEDSSIAYLPQDSIFVVTDGRENFPVIQVSWFGADAFARFTRRRLPAEAEWEKAARGLSSDFGEIIVTGVDTVRVGLGYPFPWGGQPEVDRGNFLNSGDPFENQGRVRTTPVGMYDGGVHLGYQTKSGQSWFGIDDLAGNVWEWCNDWYDIYQNTPFPPQSGNHKVIRGAGFNHGVGSAETSNRSFLDPSMRDRTVGFRTAADATP